MQLRGRALISWFPVTLLLVGITAHGSQIVLNKEDPQRGSAFAMFASVDIGATRRVFVTVPSNDSLQLVIPENFQDTASQLADSPTESNAQAFAEYFLGSLWDDDGELSPETGSRPSEVRVRVIGLDASGTTLGQQVVADVVVQGTAP
jgi:hypothetical protein